MMQGDSYSIPFTLKLKINGTSVAITAADIDEMEIRLGPVQKLYSKGEITYTNNQWAFRLSQQDTFQYMARPQKIQVRPKFKNGGDVIGAEASDIEVRRALSQVVL